MKIYVYPYGFTMVGKACQIKAKLREYMKSHGTLQGLISNHLKTMTYSNQTYKHDQYTFTIINR